VAKMVCHCYPITEFVPKFVSGKCLMMRAQKGWFGKSQTFDKMKQVTSSLQIAGFVHDTSPATASFSLKF